MKGYTSMYEPGPKDQPVETAWSNRDNNAFYDTLAADDEGQAENSLPYLAETAGLTDGADLKEVERNYLLPTVLQKINACSVLDVGSGYGRGLTWFLNKGFKKITAVERSPGYCKTLESKFGDRITLIKDDVIKLPEHTTKKYMLVLLSWSGLCDYPPPKKHSVKSKNEEAPDKNTIDQASLIQLLMQLVREDRGRLIVDIAEGEHTNATAQKGQEQQIATTFKGKKVPLYRGYVPTSDEMRVYANKVGVKTLCQRYRTTTGRDRQFWVFWHPQSESIPLTLDARRKASSQAHAEYLENRRKNKEHSSFFLSFEASSKDSSATNTRRLTPPLLIPQKENRTMKHVFG